MDRRQFIVTSSAFALAGCLSEPEAVAQWRPFVGTRRVRVAQWGMCHEHAEGVMHSLKALKDDFEIVGVVDDRASKAPRRTMPYGVFDDVPRLTPEQLLADRSIQCVFVEVSNDDLIPVAWRCARQGLAMHLDKPCGQELAPFCELSAYCRERGIPLQIGYMFRTNPAIRFCQKAVAEGWLGDVNFVEADMNHGYGGEEYDGYNATFRGGVMYNLGCHLIDFILPFFGDRAPRSVHPALLPAAPSPAESMSNCAALLEWEHGMALVRGCSRTPNGNPWRRLRIDGTKGMIDLCPIERFDGKPLTLKMYLMEGAPGYAGGTHTVDFGVQTDRYAGQLREFADVVRGIRPNDDLSAHDELVHRVTLRACALPSMKRKW